MLYELRQPTPDIGSVTEQFDVQEAASHLPQIVGHAERGEEVVTSRAGFSGFGRWFRCFDGTG